MKYPNKKSDYQAYLNWREKQDPDFVRLDDAFLAGAIYQRSKKSNCKVVAEGLWALLDDIDTLTDSIKPTDLSGYKEFYIRTMRLVEKRHLYLKTDGYVFKWKMVNEE
jgi:hypothetical protein